MIFLYSRKLQCIFLVVWFIGLVGMYINITGERPLWILEVGKLIHSKEQQAVLGKAPVVPVEVSPSPLPPPQPQAPALDPHVNHCLGLSVANANSSVLVFDMDYVPAKEKGFTLKKMHSYYLKDEPVFVLDFGDLWQLGAQIEDVRSKLLENTKIKNVRFFVTPSKKMRLLLYVSSMDMARAIRLVRRVDTDKGIQFEIKLP